MVKVQIDGKDVIAKESDTILKAAQSVGINIPNLCFMEGSQARAACRMCVCEVKGGKTLLPACATKVAEGMEIQTKTKEIIEARKQNLELILSRHSIDCKSCVRLGNCSYDDLDNDICTMCFYCDCVRDGDCELQSLMEEYNVTGQTYKWVERSTFVDRSTISLEKDYGKCILCQRCVSVCKDKQGMNVWSVAQRGYQTEIIPVGGTLANSPCVECGECAKVCPVGSLYTKQDLDSLLDGTEDLNKSVVVQIEDGFLDEYLKFTNLDSSKLGVENIVAGLKRLGVDDVVSGDKFQQIYSSKLQNEIVDSINANISIIVPECEASRLFVEQKYPYLVKHLSTTPTALTIFGEWTKSVYGDKAYGISLSVSSTKKREAERTQTQLVLTPREIHRLFTRSGVDLSKLKATQLSVFELKDECIKEHKQHTNILHANGLKEVADLLNQFDKLHPSVIYIKSS